MSVIKKKKHVSKKNKKAWRKHCDIRDVEEFLEDKRLEERLGEFSVKPDSELFIIDTAGAEVKAEETEEKPVLTLKQRKRAQLSVTPKCFEALLSTSKVKDPNAKRNHVNPFGIKPTALSKITERRRVAKGAYEKKLELAKKNRKIALEKRRKMKQNRQTFELDMWGDKLPEQKGIPETLCDEFMSAEAQHHNVLPERRLRSKPPLAEKIISVPAVTAPHPGVSYNPTYKEHQELLHQVVDCEQKLMKKEQHLHRVTTRMFGRVTLDERQDQWHTEMSAGLPTPGERSESKPESGDESDNEYKAINPPVKNKKKDHKTRRKQKERLVEMERLKREKIDKKKITDIYKLRKLESSISARSLRAAERGAAKRERRTTKARGSAPALSKHRVPAPEPCLVEAASLQGALRSLSHNGNPLRDRYQSLQMRGALAGAKLMMKKKMRVKSYFKAGHKVTDQDVEKYLAKAAAEKK